ncbi:lysophospholipid acyltransferase family protein [Puniceicoccales bacterium CK1056]|uniref:Lysophospholipid acyltransferase family protein n=1 Tax=Oceanipulchritudo coccoides TaxID=2706888 RepID=A0A6B2LZ76_9BACT|nr:lysophospholipid acyltransferase family protein [Oceanipulchritudo coccoides]NDV61366.1 lysophospholipid acyltransferase family protein [Oceanipulchritudo coccoides]
MPHNTSTSLWRPGNLLAAFGVLLMKGSARLPLSWSRGIGKFIGSVVAIIFPYRRHVALTNLRLCLPELTEKERKDLLFRHYQSMGIGLFELAAAWYKPVEKLEEWSTVTGLEHLEAVAESGRGALLLTAHFTTLEISGRLLLNKRPFSCLYRRPDQPVIAKAMTEARKSRMNRVIHWNETNDLIRALRDGEFIWYAPDQGKRMKYSAILPFFGVPAVTNTATGRLARLGKAAIVPFLGYRDAKGHYHVEIYPELKDIPSEDPDADAVKINQLIESFIRKAPDQYFWLHRRFKKRGAGFEDVYAKSGRGK